MPIGGAAIIARFIRSIRRITISAVFVLSASAASQIHPALAQTVPIQELEPVIVTATRLPAKEKELTSSVTVITREEIEQQHANRVSEIIELFLVYTSMKWVPAED
jgi:outer membrane receptor protein involved in Fe transport